MSEITTKDIESAESDVTYSTGIKWVMLIYFCSGMCSLIDEVVWVRLLKLTLGNTVYASSIVVSVFMGGLALGALIMARYADRVRRPLLLYAGLEVCAAISALSLPLALRFADVVYRWFYVNHHPSPTGLLLVQIIVSAGLLLVPTMVMGSTLPLLGRYVTSLQGRTGRLVGRLYAVNTFGAALGCFLAGFVLIRMVGVMGTLYIAAGINLLVAFGGWVLSRAYDIAGEPRVEADAGEQPGVGIEGAGKWRLYILMLAFFVSGLISIGYELIWMRSIVFLLGGYTYVFSAVLTVYLLGNVVGAWIGSRLSKRLKHPEMWFGVSLSCLGIFGILYIPWLSLWAWNALPRFMSLFGGLTKNPVFNGMVLPLFHSTFLFLLVAVTMGIGFPLALQAWSNYRHKVGQTTGTVYGVNTIGAVLGGVLTGFVLIPLMGVQLSVTVLGLFGLWLGGIMIQLYAVRIRIIGRVVYLGIAVAVTIAALGIPSDLFRDRFVWYLDTKLLAVKEGVTTTVSVHEGAGGDLTLITSGNPVAGDFLRVPQKVLGHLGVFLNKTAKQVLSVGFGSGETAACMSLHNLERIDSVEISPELVEISKKFFQRFNSGVNFDEKVNMFYMDAKNYMHLTDRRYDLIINDCIDPKAVADNASLFTKEYFQSALEHLNPGGMFGTYFPFATLPISCIDSILGTFMEVFPYVTVWFPTTAPIENDFLFLAGTGKPMLFSPEHIDNELQRKGVLNSADYINFHNSQYVLSCYIGDQDNLKRYLKGFNLNSDFSPYVEFNTDLVESSSLKRQWFAQFIAKVRSNSILEYIDWTGMSQDEQEKWRQDYELFYKISTYLLKSRMEQNVLSTLQDSFDGLRLMPEHATLLWQEDRFLTFMRDMLENDQISPERVIADVDKLLQEQPGFGAAWLIKSWALQYRNEITDALSAGEKAVDYIPYSAQAQENMGVLLLRSEQIGRAIAYFSEAARLKPTEERSYYNLGTAFAAQGRFDEAILQFRQGLRIQPRDEKVHCILGDLLLRQGRINEAVSEYREALQINPEYIMARNRLNDVLAR